MNPPSHYHTSIAGEVRCGPEGFGIKLANGTLLQCSHNHPEGTRLPTYESQPAIVLKLDDGSDIFLPIIVCECCCRLLRRLDC